MFPFALGKKPATSPGKAAPKAGGTSATAQGRPAPRPNPADKGAEGPSSVSPAAPEMGAARPDDGTVSSYDRVPTHQSVLTLGPNAIFRVPKELERHLMALECGPKRAILLYDPEFDVAKMKQALSALRIQMQGQSYKFDGAERRAHASVLAQLHQDTMRRCGAESGERMQDSSGARKLFESWVDQAVRERATDLHIEVVSSSKAVVRIRVDGELETLRDKNNGQYPVAQAIDAMAWAFNVGSGRGSNSQSNYERNQNLYCMIDPRPVGEKQIAIRYQSVRGWQGPKLICRLLNVDTNAPTLSYTDLGYSASQVALWRECAKMSAGFVLIAGVTGSGKTTTLKTFIETHPGNGSSAFYSIEDPVEYPLKGVHQIPLQRDLLDKEGSAAKFAEVVGALMRGDPDGVLVGEIRDTATAMAGQQIVETGHMAAGTVHAHLISGILPRLTNDEIGMSREVLTNPNMLSMLAYQALVPKLCQQCCLPMSEVIQQVGASSATAEHVKSIAEDVKSRFGYDPERLRYRNAGGCDHCNRRGTRGLTVVAEMMIPDRKWLSLARQGDDYEAVMHYRSHSDGRMDSPDMTGKTVFEHAFYKALMQQIDPRQCERFDSFARFEVIPRQGLRGIAA